MTTDQVELLRRDNVVSDEAEIAGTTLEGLGIISHSIEAVVPAYLNRDRTTGQHPSQARE